MGHGGGSGRRVSAEKVGFFNKAHDGNERSVVHLSTKQLLVLVFTGARAHSAVMKHESRIDESRNRQCIPMMRGLE